MLDKTKLAEAINDAIGAVNPDGSPLEVTPEMETYADAVITTLTTSTFNHPLVSGITAAGSPLVNGSALGGIFVPLVPATWTATLAAGFPTANPGALSLEAACSTAYLSTAALVNFDAGKITGQCTSTTSSPGPLGAGSGSQGEISGIDGQAWSSLCVPPTGDPAAAKKIYDAIATYIKENAEAEYPSATVNGACPAGGGPLTAGVGAGGIIK